MESPKQILKEINKQYRLDIMCPNDIYFNGRECMIDPEGNPHTDDSGKVIIDRTFFSALSFLRYPYNDEQELVDPLILPIETAFSIALSKAESAVNNMNHSLMLNGIILDELSSDIANELAMANFQRACVLGTMNAFDKGLIPLSHYDFCAKVLGGGRRITSLSIDYSLSHEDDMASPSYWEYAYNHIVLHEHPHSPFPIDEGYRCNNCFEILHIILMYISRNELLLRRCPVCNKLFLTSRDKQWLCSSACQKAEKMDRIKKARMQPTYKKAEQIRNMLKQQATRAFNEKKDTVAGHELSEALSAFTNSNKDMRRKFNAGELTETAYMEWLNSQDEKFRLRERKTQDQE